MPDQPLEQEVELEGFAQRLAGLTKLVELTCELSALTDLDKILRIVTTGVCKAISSERASLFLYDERHGELYTRVVTELEIEEIRASIDSGITGWVGRERKVANIRQPYADARWNASVDRRTGFHTQNILAAPVISAHDDRLLGVLQILNKSAGSFTSDDERLLQAFASHAASALERANLLEETRRAQELQLSISLARSIQASFLPKTLIEIPGYEVAAWWQPAEDISGDYYDVVPLPDGRLGLVVADVSGHGIGPSLIMASARAMLHVAMRTASDPGRILSLLSETIEPDLATGCFITFLIVALDPLTHELTLANAGHAPALYFERATRKFHPLSSTGPPLGFTSDFVIPNGPKLKMAPGDLLVLATDGAIELRNPAGEMFGRQRLEQLVLDNCTRPVSEIADVLKAAITDFDPDNPPPDDVTLLLLERKLH